MGEPAIEVRRVSIERNNRSYASLYPDNHVNERNRDVATGMTPFIRGLRPEQSSSSVPKGEDARPMRHNP